MRTEALLDTVEIAQNVERIFGGDNPLLPLDILNDATVRHAPGVFVAIQQRIFQRLGFRAFLPIKGLTAK